MNENCQNGYWQEGEFISTHPRENQLGLPTKLVRKGKKKIMEGRVACKTKNQKKMMDASDS